MSSPKTFRLDECCEIVSGSTPKTGESANWDGDICWATPKDLSDLGGMLICDTSRKITQRGLDSCGASMLPTRSVLFSSRAPIGHVAINTRPMATNQGFKSFVPKPELVHPEYLYYWLRANREYLNSLGNGATFKEVSKATIARVTVPLPPLPEQRRIAAILDKADALRAKRRAALAELDDLAQAIFLEMFGDPTTNPMKWPRVTLGSIVVDGFQNGLYKPSSDYGSGTSILRIDAFYDGKVRDVEKLKRVRISAPEVACYGLREGDVVINRVNSMQYLGKSCIVPRLIEPVVFESNMMRFGINQTVALPDYVVAFLQSGYTRTQIERSAKQAVNQASINQKDVSSFLINIPPVALQETYVRRIGSNDELGTLHRASLTELDALFATLQHRAFRGDL